MDFKVPNQTFCCCRVIMKLVETLLLLIVWTRPVISFNEKTVQKSNYLKHVYLVDHSMRWLHSLNWTELAVVSDEELILDLLLQKLAERLLQVELKYIPSVQEQLHSATQEQKLDLLAIWDSMKSVNILIAGSQELQKESLSQMARLSSVSLRLSSLVLDTHWLVLTNSHVIETGSFSSLSLNHLALVVHDSQTHNTAVKTLAWTADGFRRLADVTHSPENGDVPASIFPTPRFGMNQIRLRIATLTWHQYVIKHQNNVTNDTSYTGLCMDLLDIIARSLNFTYELVAPPDGEWGDNLSGNWTGLVGMVQRQEVDMVMAPLTPSPERGTVADWTSPFDYWQVGLVAQNDGPDYYLWTSFLAPFEWQVYLTIVTTYLCYKMIVCCFLHTERRFHGCGDITSYTCTGFLNSFIRCFLGEDAELALVHESSRTFVFSWYLLSLVLTSCYTCKMTSLLVSVPDPPPFTSLAGMLEREDFRWGTVGGSLMLADLRRSQNEVHEKVYQRLLAFAGDDPDVLNLDPNVHLSKVLQGRYAYFSSALDLQRWASQHCDVTYLPAEVSGFLSYNIFTPKHSALTARLDTIVRRLQDTGVLSYLQSKWFPRTNGCQDTKTTTSITIATLQGPFYLAAGGLFLALIVVVIEKLMVHGL